MTAIEWPLTDADRESVAEDLRMERRALERIDDTEPMRHLIQSYLDRRKKCVAEIEKLEAMLADDSESRATVPEDAQAHERSD